MKAIILKKIYFILYSLGYLSFLLIQKKKKKIILENEISQNKVISILDFANGT